MANSIPREWLKRDEDLWSHKDLYETIQSKHTHDSQKHIQIPSTRGDQLLDVYPRKGILLSN